ncbi:MAG: hypothetical protein OIN85_07730, partial [Candidatus Methanoperedens sp.]|nr:hypothetical protein [Candidatus Methanoperedens sp.]
MEPQIHADESRLIKSDEENSLLIFRSFLFEFVVRYRAHTCLGISKNKPQINADERRLIKSEDENSLLIFRSFLFEFVVRYRAHTCP